MRMICMAEICFFILDNRRMTRLLRLLMQPATSIGPRLRHYISGSKGNASTMLAAILKVNLSWNDVMILGDVSVFDPTKTSKIIRFYRS
jgi:hypothetical protein